MSARDLYHDAVVHALVADGWAITHDPLTLALGGRDLYVDLGATHVTVGAEREGRRIAVEVKSFLSPSPVRDLEEAVGQYAVYRSVMAQVDPDRVLYLAVPRRTFEGIFAERIGQAVLASEALRIVVFDESNEKVVRWLP